MRKLLRRLLTKPLSRLGNYVAAAPQRDKVFQSLTNLYNTGIKPNNNSCIIIDGDSSSDNFIVFSDQHKGNKTWADDFCPSQAAYVGALQYYNSKGFKYINLGDCEELWKFTADDILPCNETALGAEAAFQPDRYFRTFGNHDLIWKNKLDVDMKLKDYFLLPMPVHEGIIIHLKHNEKIINIFLTHGHQGDVMSDNNAFSTWVVAHLWLPIQRYLHLNINQPSKDYTLRNKHNIMMHEWSSSQEGIILVTGHTHHPVFASGRYLAHPNNIIPDAGKFDEAKPSYFNTGCCCFSDGDITGLEFSGGYARLVKWHSKGQVSHRKVLEEILLEDLIRDLDM